eukprot:793863-Amphidinium_carterae.1
MSGAWLRPRAVDVWHLQTAASEIGRGGRIGHHCRGQQRRRALRVLGLLPRGEASGEVQSRALDHGCLGSGA